MKIPNVATLLILIHHFVLAEKYTGIPTDSKTSLKAYKFLLEHELIKPCERGFVTTARGSEDVIILMSLHY